MYCHTCLFAFEQELIGFGKGMDGMGERKAKLFVSLSTDKLFENLVLANTSLVPGRHNCCCDPTNTGITGATPRATPLVVISDGGQNLGYYNDFFPHCSNTCPGVRTTHH